MEVKISQTKIFFALCLFTLLVISGYEKAFRISPKSQESSDDVYAVPTLNRDYSDGSCPLPFLDPYHPSGMKFHDETYNPLKDCVPSFTVRSKIINQTIFIEPAKDSWLYERCWHRCIFMDTELNYNTSEWVSYESENKSTTDCEVVEVRCSNLIRMTYIYLHVQIVKQPPKSPPPSPAASNVYIIVIDSTSTGNFKRALPKTKEYLENRHQAITFNYLNKVGWNSRGNAMAFLVNEASQDIAESPWGPEVKIAGEDYCYKPLDNLSYIFYDFNNAGYRTFAMDDSGVGTFNSPDCIGFTKKPADHYVKQFARRMENLAYEDVDGLSANHNTRQCRDSYEALFETLEEFSTVYNDEAKMGMIWFTHLAHSEKNELYRADDVMLKYFKDLEDTLDNSFVFFMSDHGPRYGGFRQSFIGVLEELNPFFTLTLPKKLRRNEDLMDLLRNHSNQLLTQFDVYATLLEIAKENHKWISQTNFSTEKFSVSDRKLKGSSILHPLPGPRHCNSLLIPINFCLCQQKQVKIEDSTLLSRVGEMMVEKMNADIKKSMHQGDCAKLKMDKRFGELAKIGEGDKVIYKAVIRVRPGGGSYETQFTVKNGEVKLLSERFPRLDSYKAQASCIPPQFLQNYCYCK
uniref:Sulfatase domain-containing protein n=1 Tax=Bursaphelenchus xylophilus TaxID=6326 RepID=A0A1I7S5N4_BURXY